MIVFDFERGFTKLSIKVSDDQYPEFADLYTKLVNSKYCSTVIGAKIFKLNTIPSQYDGAFLIKLPHGDYLRKRMVNHRYHNHRDPAQYSEHGTLFKFPKFNNVGIFKKLAADYQFQYAQTDGITPEELTKQYPDAELFSVEYEFESGTTEGMYGYVERRKN